MRAVASSSPSVKSTPAETLVSVTDIRPHASIGAGVSVFARILLSDNREDEREDDRAGVRDGEGREPRRSRRRRAAPLIRFDLSRQILATTDPPLAVDSTTTFGVLRGLALESDSLFAPAVAVDLLSRRDHSEAELRRKLHVRGFSRSAVDHAVATVQDRNYQDDRRFAASWIRSRMSGSGTSRTALLAGLLRRGVDRAQAEEAIAEYHRENPDCFRDALGAALDSLAGDDRDTQLRKLARRGFDSNEIRKRIRLHY